MLSFSDLVLGTFTRLWGAVSVFKPQLSFALNRTTSVCVTDVPAATVTDCYLPARRSGRAASAAATAAADAARERERAPMPAD